MENDALQNKTEMNNFDDTYWVIFDYQLTHLSAQMC